ncbi:hypothetical protein MMC20_007318 [Loxospora ochrophaea]|nr:hypothetical protein [Loxospora ochrophaea]
MPPKLSTLETLPHELQHNIFAQLLPASLSQVARTSSKVYSVVIPILYHSIELVDFENLDTGDPHDDTPIIRLLLLFSRNTYLASQVRELTHRCHLHLPDVWQDLPRMSFQSATISQDKRLHALLFLAIRNLTNVHTLRIIFGHHTISKSLLEGFLVDPLRTAHSPMRRLWLESCCLDGVRWAPSNPPLSSSLESIRCRRMNFDVEDHAEEFSNGIPLVPRFGFWLTRNKDRASPGDFGTYNTSSVVDPDVQRHGSNEDSIRWDNEIYQQFPMNKHLYAPLNPPYIVAGRPDILETLMPGRFIGLLMQGASKNLTNLVLDWVHDSPEYIAELRDAHFPNLRAFQVRNAVEPLSCLPLTDDFMLLGKPWSRFLRRHRSLQCLAWPIDLFLPLNSTPDTATREIIAQLGSTIKELRVDAQVNRHGEPVTSRSLEKEFSRPRSRRRAFIEHVVSRMEVLEVIKVEGSIPFDERREIIRALQLCPVRKVVIIGFIFTAHSTWNKLDGVIQTSLRYDQVDARSPIVERADADFSGLGEGRNRRLTPLEMEQVREQLGTEEHKSQGLFTGSYGSEYPTILETLSLTQASTVTELKFCGFNGAPLLFHPEIGTATRLWPLRYFHKLRNFVSAVTISTLFDRDNRTEEIVSLWQDREVGNSWHSDTSWKLFMMERFEPGNMARSVAQLVGPYLSEEALSSRHGVNVKILFMMWREVRSDLYEMTVQLGEGGKVRSFGNPRGEDDEDRRREGLETRGWF